MVEIVEMEMATLHRRAVESWAARVDAIADDQWRNATPCLQWTVRDLVNHMVGRERWAVLLANGAGLPQAGHGLDRDLLDGDLLGGDPVGAAHRAAEEAVAAVDRHSARDRGLADQVYLWEHVHQLVAEHLVHGWDLAVATGGATRLDPGLVRTVALWFDDMEGSYRDTGLVGPRVYQLGDPQTELLAAFGRDVRWAAVANV
jgi:uncharacterized protein (TIGR03086 family)